MSAAASIARYQSRELAIRWKAQPASPLARWFLTFALAAAAGVLLLGFAAAESARRAELRRLGLDTVVIQAPAESALVENAPFPPDHWAAPLASQGSLLLLQQLPEPAFTPWGEPLAAFATSLRRRGSDAETAAAQIRVQRIEAGAALPTAEPRHASLAISAIFYTRRLPPNRVLRVTQDGLPLVAVTAAPTGSLEALGLDDFLVESASDAPAGSGPAGRLDVLLFHPEGGAGDAVGAVRRTFAAEGLPPPVIRDPAPYQAALDAFTRTQDRWRAGMAALLCACILLAFGSIGMLEERQTRYTQALLRSLGVSGAYLWAFALLENIILADTALAAALAASRAGSRVILALAGASPAVSAPIGGVSLLWLACAVNAGVLLSLMPLARALRRPVGVVLP